MNRRVFLSTAAAGLLSPQLSGSRKPNVVFILADDLGYGDLSCYGQKMFATPNLDRLAEEGMRFTQAYAGSTVCAPSRCCLMTGLHTGHARIRGNARHPLRPEDTTVAEVLKRAGYRTGLIGKWGLGEAGSTGMPHRKGFDEFFGYLNQQHAHSYYPDHLWENDSDIILAGNLGVPKEYSHDLFAERALKFVDKHRAEPFFLYLAFTIPHANNEMGRDSGNGMEVPDAGEFASRNWPQQEKNFAAMVTRMDRDIGKFMAKLKETGIDQHTLVIFSSDNGPHREGGHDPDFFDSNGALRGIKRDLYEGGIRVPTMARWPGHIRPGVSDHIWSFPDFLPTAAEVAGARAPSGLDGVSILPTLLGKSQPQPQKLYWEFHERGFTQGVRFGDWKAVRKGGKTELYNLRQDLSETKDVAAGHADIVAKAEKMMRESHVESELWPVKS